MLNLSRIAFCLLSAHALCYGLVAGSTVVLLLGLSVGVLAIISK